jgi:RimJ/RimL family protein N-acetyltransferase
MEIRTARLLLRELSPDDAPALNAIESDPRVTRFMAFDPQSPADTQRYLEANRTLQSEAPRRVFDLAIVAADGRLIGRCGLKVSRPEHFEGNVWYVLHPEHWGRGFAAEAVAALLEFGFGGLKLHRIWADCDPRNVASCHLAEKLGMRLEGRLRENYWLKGEWCDTVVYAMLAHERPIR